MQNCQYYCFVTNLYRFPAFLVVLEQHWMCSATCIIVLCMLLKDVR